MPLELLEMMAVFLATFSTFSLETQALLRDGRSAAAWAYVAASLIGGVALAAAGYVVAGTRGA